MSDNCDGALDPAVSLVGRRSGDRAVEAMMNARPLRALGPSRGACAHDGVAPQLGVGTEAAALVLMMASGRSRTLALKPQRLCS